MHPSLRLLALLGLLLLVSRVGSASDRALPEAEPLLRQALATQLAERAVMLGLARAGERLIAVGERGIALVSDDNGHTWRQASVPVSVTLTGARFIDSSHGWAIGHNGVLLSTDDGGDTWKRVFDGRDVIQMYEGEALRLATLYGETDERTLRTQTQARQLAADGPDKPWLDLTIDDAGRLWLVGAYGLVLRSTDKAHWEPWSSRLDNPKDLHLYAIKASGDVIVIAGEQGLILRSTDGGDHFSRLDSPYKGSFFELQLQGGEIFIAGLRGHAFVSNDNGGHFNPVPLPAPVSVTTSLRLADGGIVFANQGGGLFHLVEGRLQAGDASAGVGASALIQAADGSLIVAGGNGPRRLGALFQRGLQK